MEEGLGVERATLVLSLFSFCLSAAVFFIVVLGDTTEAENRQTGWSIQVPHFSSEDIRIQVPSRPRVHSDAPCVSFDIGPGKQQTICGTFSVVEN